MVTTAKSATYLGNAGTKGDFASAGAAAPRIGTGGAWLFRTGPQQRISQLVVWGGPLGNMVMGTFDGFIHMGYDLPRLDRRLADGGQGITINEQDGGLFIDLELPAIIADRMPVRLRIATGEQAIGTMERTPCDMRFSATAQPAIPGCAWDPAIDFLLEDAWLAGLCEQGLACYTLIPQEMVP